MKNFSSIAVAVAALFIISVAYGGNKHSTPDFAWANGLLYEAEQTSNYAPVGGARNTLCIFQGLKGRSRIRSLHNFMRFLLSGSSQRPPRLSRTNPPISI